MDAAFRRRDISIADPDPVWLLGKAPVRRTAVVVFCRSRLNSHVAEKAWRVCFVAEIRVWITETNNSEQHKTSGLHAVLLIVIT